MNKVNNLKKKKKKKINENNIILDGIINIHASFNNTIITLTDLKGNTLSFSSPGLFGFKGSKKSTPFSAQIAIEKCSKFMKKRGINNLKIKVKGPGPGRDSTIRTLNSLGFNIISIVDVTPIPHNGCRSPKRRRI
ncbi:30S ribosomal protein S11 [Enterobacterales bacterium endosymbiont of Anomoneura mori]|uniref:30S ribosomal protein S11 n=1 Tax=Enterobacterales bacterium endosymbiont of Anomoneura mori TaxID=3132096 RepID=UPI00399D4681